jgi:hypothetical protein
MDPISLEELALLEALVEVDQASKEQLRIKALNERLVETGLVVMVDGELKLTDAGIERCKSLHHRVKADKEAAEVLKEREQSSEAKASGE